MSLELDTRFWNCPALLPNQRFSQLVTTVANWLPVDTQWAWATVVNGGPGTRLFGSTEPLSTQTLVQLAQAYSAETHRLSATAPFPCWTANRAGELRQMTNYVRVESWGTQYLGGLSQADPTFGVAQLAITNANPYFARQGPRVDPQKVAHINEKVADNLEQLTALFHAAIEALQANRAKLFNDGGHAYQPENAHLAYFSGVKALKRDFSQPPAHLKERLHTLLHANYFDYYGSAEAFTILNYPYFVNATIRDFYKALSFPDSL